MSDTTVKQKLALIQQVRSNYDRDQFDLSNREKILYGKTSPRNYTRSYYSDMPYNQFEEDADIGLASLKLRFLIAAVLLAAIILLDLNGGTFAGITAKEVFDAIAIDYTTEIDHLFSDSQVPQ